jgi:hypothetical protein
MSEHASWPEGPPITTDQLERLGMVRCCVRACSKWVNPHVVPWPRPKGFSDRWPRYCSEHWRQRVKKRAQQRRAEARMEAAERTADV